MLTEPVPALEQLLLEGSAAALFLPGDLLRDPHWPLHAARVPGNEVAWPPPYDRARPR